MPIISAFFGIMIRMFYKEHEPAHFHAEHASERAKFDFDGEIIAGEIRSRKARERIREWARQHRYRTRSELGAHEGWTSFGKHRTIARGQAMTFLPTVIRAEHRGGFRLHVIFNDASENTIDFEPWLDGPVFEPLKDPQYFQRFFVDGGTVVWPNGADIAPETLYEVAGRRRRPNPYQPSSRQGRRSFPSGRRVKKTRGRKK